MELRFVRFVFCLYRYIFSHQKIPQIHDVTPSNICAVFFVFIFLKYAAHRAQLPQQLACFAQDAYGRLEHDLSSLSILVGHVQQETGDRVINKWEAVLVCTTTSWYTQL